MARAPTRSKSKRPGRPRRRHPRSVPIPIRQLVADGPAVPSRHSSSLPAGRLGRLAAVAPEGPGRGELAELVPDHILGHVELDEVLAVVDRKVLADELGYDRAGTRPGLDRLAVPGLV